MSGGNQALDSQDTANTRTDDITEQPLVPSISSIPNVEFLNNFRSVMENRRGSTWMSVRRDTQQQQQQQQQQRQRQQQRPSPVIPGPQPGRRQSGLPRIDLGAPSTSNLHGEELAEDNSAHETEHDHVDDIDAEEEMAHSQEPGDHVMDEDEDDDDDGHRR
ncbi:hypothetical protein DL89DRAFT_318592 [Linderina pennispora]|uniref:Uncharacterized protein n=1 Tax=Linderina pennispora TaxID=61395 RepID=A0A1Y1W5D2_9FUNG|nr:uncharacterized protein DL89DRAFT_318592 [Linderina pennispora]ORX68743.1 hypothetical protein DL89DRAFT_318592 [Linderina pennispora]